jgi:hypothetical protein
MRRQAKPFTVEVRKSRKAGTGPEPLFSPELLALEAEPARRSDLPTPALFSSPAPAKPRILEAEPERPSTRILPDLSAVAAAPNPEAEVTELRAEVPKPRKARKPRSAVTLPLDEDDEEADDAIVLPFAVMPASKRVMPSRAARRAKRAAAGMPVPRWERWKRRLPPVLR